MQETESQIAKIQLGKPKQTGSFVYAMAEKATGSEAELFLIAEIPVTTTENSETCENICQPITTAFRRVYARPFSENSFENAISEINEELGQVASQGQTHWINKINAIIAIRYENNFYISSCGKVSAFLLRAGDFTDISCSEQTTHPLKTFETFASGKIRLGDLLILSTTQMFNYLSMDRFKDLILNDNFLRATQVIIQLLKDNAGPNVAFCTILNMQVPFGQAGQEEVDLENFVIEEQPKNNILEKVFTYIKNIIPLKTPKTFSVPKISIPKFSPNLKTLGTTAKTVANASQKAVSLTKTGFSEAKKQLSWEKVKSYSPQKKFFFISLSILFVVVIVNITLAFRYKNTQKQDQQVFANIQEASALLSKVSDSLLYKNETSAREFYQTALTKLPKEGAQISAKNKTEYEKLLPLLSEIRAKMDKTLTAQVESLGSLSAGHVLLRLPNALGTENAGNVTSYDLGNKKILDGAYKSPSSILGIISINSTDQAVFSVNGLSVWTAQNNKTSPIFTTNVPNEKDFGGLGFYSDNKKIYLVNKSLNKVFSLSAGASGFSKPTVAVDDEKLKNSQSLTIDGNIYILTSNDVLKYTKGVLQKFQLPFMLNTFSGEGKIYTQKDFKYIYILDSAQKRIIVLDKLGNLMGNIQNPTFTNLKDFLVEEKTKTIYVLNGLNLLKVNW
jgi:hypothetical protein